ncbi:MAG: hypothetical protein DRG37_08865 [Deltaproteobacteria bacterium]|nr:MAG: hypothetical protein DRG37_08865 [Deltaproteobacteria bacterium]
MKRVLLILVSLLVLCGSAYAVDTDEPRFYGSVSPMFVIPDISTGDFKDIGFDADFTNGYGVDASGGVNLNRHVGIDIDAQYVTHINANDTVWSYSYSYYYYMAVPIDVDIDGSGYYVSLGTTIFGDRSKMIAPFLRFSIGSMGIRMKVDASLGPYSISDHASDNALAFSVNPGLIIGASRRGRLKGIFGVEYVVGRGDLDDVRYFAVKCGVAF